MAILLEATHVTKVFGEGLFGINPTVALDDFSFAIQATPPSITAVVGESGSGKTTLARLLLGLIIPTRGRVMYNGMDLRTMSAAQWFTFRKDVQVIFQDPFEVYNPFYKVDHVLMTPVKKFGLAKSRQARTALIEDVLQAVGLRPEETLGRHPHELSGGQRQRVMVARALLLRPRLIVADEPVSMIDASLRATVLASLCALNRDFGISIIYITHDLATAYQISENIIVLYRGSVVEAGDVELIVKQPQHPYTQLLLNSVPRPDPNFKWEGESPSSAAGCQAGKAGCKFADRCGADQSECLESAPPLFRVDPHRLVACHRYHNSPEIESADMTQVFTSRVPHTPAARIEFA